MRFSFYVNTCFTMIKIEMLAFFLKPQFFLVFIIFYPLLAEQYGAAFLIYNYFISCSWSDLFSKKINISRSLRSV